MNPILAWAFLGMGLWLANRQARPGIVVEFGEPQIVPPYERIRYQAERPRRGRTR